MESAQDAMREHSRKWEGGAIPDDFVRVMSSDPKNLQATHAKCNESKSNSRPGWSTGAAKKANREAEAQERRRQEEAKWQSKLQHDRERAERAAWWGSRWDWRRGPGPDRDTDGAGILA